VKRTSKSTPKAKSSAANSSPKATLKTIASRHAKMPIISVSHLTKKYRTAKENSVTDVSFAVEEGSFFSLLGPNGAGKTTTLSILTTILSPTAGEAIVAGYNVNKNPSEVRNQIGVIFQNPSLDLNLTAEENIRFHANLYGLYSYKPAFRLMDKEYQEKVDELSKVLELSKEIFNPVKTFSGGMKRKLEIMRSLLHRPKILFLDEPTTGLDPISRRNLWTYLQKVRKEQTVTIFLTTHYLEEAEVSDQICVMDKGKILVLGTPDEIKKHWKAKSLEDAYIKMIYKRHQEE